MPTEDELRYWIGRGELKVVRNAEDSVDGFVIFDLSPAQLYLRYWFVHPRARGKGVGGKLMRTMFAAAVQTKRQILITASLMKGRIAGKSLDSVVYISSVTGFVGTRGTALYGASKGMLSAFVKASAVEFVPKVRVNAICPAAVETEMSRELLSDPVLREACARRHPLGIANRRTSAEWLSFCCPTRHLGLRGSRSLSMAERFAI